MATAAGMVYMKCERFEHRHENRRFLLDQLKALLAEARKAGTAEDPLAATADYAQHKAGYEAVVDQHTSALVRALQMLTPEQLVHIAATEPELVAKVPHFSELQGRLPEAVVEEHTDEDLIQALQMCTPEDIWQLMEDGSWPELAAKARSELSRLA